MNVLWTILAIAAGCAILYFVIVFVAIMVAVFDTDLFKDDDNDQEPFQINKI
jgi:hypothetical protein